VSLDLEHLEDRCVPAVYKVISAADNLLPVTPTGTPGVFKAPSLRSAIQAANTNGSANNTIQLAVGGTYRITIPGALEDNNQTGDFDILSKPGGSLTIVNASGRNVAVDGNHLDRVFDINPNNVTGPFLVTLQGFTIQNGIAADPANVDGGTASGGGIRDVGNASLTLNNMIVTNNTATADGGGISMENDASTPWTLTVNRSVISNNRAGDAGGGIDEDGSGHVIVSLSTISGNICVNQGAGIWLDAIAGATSSLTISQSLISANVAINGPTGGIGNAGNGAVAILSSTVANNFSGGAMTGGGGFGDENNLGTLFVLNSTFVGNSSTQNGGGIQEGGPSTVIDDSTITGNVTAAEGGGLFITSPSFTLQNTIVAGNLSNAGGMNFQGANPDLLGTPTTAIANFIGGNPLLGPLQNNGGPTPTMAPPPGSPVIDMGANGAIPAGTRFDQRGFNRVVNNVVDIGAVEFQPPATRTVLKAKNGILQALVVGLAPVSNVPQGTVVFIIDGKPEHPVQLVNGVAVLKLGKLPGHHTVTAIYQGDVNFDGSTTTRHGVIL
jgi:hypothetical protein